MFRVHPNFDAKVGLRSALNTTSGREGDERTLYVSPDHESCLVKVSGTFVFFEVRNES